MKNCSIFTVQLEIKSALCPVWRSNDRHRIFFTRLI